MNSKTKIRIYFFIGLVIYQYGCFYNSMVYANDLNSKVVSNVYFRDIKKAHSLSFIDHSGYQIYQDESCLKEGCASTKVAEKKIMIERYNGNTKLGGKNIASMTCLKASGHPIVLYTEKNDEISACMWKDKSISLSWDLIRLSTK
ncbi:MAG: hypothetical protein HQK51_03115 [Oligoflexia bacterium]|nr:hypothetical protein [Oligoflexia bacterium]